MFHRSLFVLLVVVATVGLVGVGWGADDSARGLKIVVTTDVHGYVEYDQEAGRPGLGRLKAYLDQARQGGELVFLLDSGDAFSGSALAQVDRGRGLAELMGLAGYRVLTPGNHAFDHNQVEANPFYYNEVLLKIWQAHSVVPVAATAVNLAVAGGELPGVSQSPVIIYEGGGLRVAVIGVITPYVARQARLDYLPGYDFGRVEESKKDAWRTTQNIKQQLAKALNDFDRPGDVVIVLSHVGHGDGEAGLINGLDLATVPNVDFVADGHSHQPVEPQLVGRAYYGNGGRYLENFLELNIGPDGGGRMELKGFAALANLTPDPVIEGWLLDFTQRLGLTEKLFDLADDSFSDKNIDRENTPLGHFICRAMQEVTQADLALHNVGGIRAGLAKGPVTVRDIYDVLPFANDLVTVSLTGREVKDIFERGFGRGGRSMPQYYGLTVHGWRDGEGHFRVSGLSLDSTGKPLAPDQKYLVALNSFMLNSRGLSHYKTRQDFKLLGDLTTLLIHHWGG